MSHIISASPLFAAVCYLILAIEYSALLRGVGVIFLAPFLYSALWSRYSGFDYRLDFLQAAIWSIAFAFMLTRQSGGVKRSGGWYLIWTIPGVCVVATVFSAIPGIASAPVDFYLYLVCCIATLLITEQLVRSNSGVIRIIGIGIGGLLLFNLYIYATALFAGKVSVELVETRQLANATVALLLCLAPLFAARGERPRKVGLSRPMVFATTSLLIAGSILLLITGLGYALRLSEYEHGLILQQFSLFVLVLLLGFYLSSPAHRARVRVWINKNFFHTKYDYNSEWRLLSERLSQSTDKDDDYIGTAINAVANIYNGTGGACYVQDGDQYIPAPRSTTNGQLKPVSAAGAKPFLDKMRVDNWIFFPATTDAGLAQCNESIPEILVERDDILFILPINHQDELMAFIIVYGDCAQVDNFDFEDRDLLGMVSKQIASFLGYQMLTEERMVTMQFEAFHQFTTFVMHDLKNLVAQQALVVENARRFIDNPEFVADAIKTIENSVNRMNKLMTRINQNTHLDSRAPQLQPVRLDHIIQDAAARCSRSKPTPELLLPETPPTVNSDPESLVMAFTHLISNAQDACMNGNGTIKVVVASCVDHIECKIIDNGVGMDQEFIDNRLFKPFYSTKSSKGMGIGAYQYRKILSNIGGKISVESHVGEGTCFTIRLPLAQPGDL